MKMHLNHFHVCLAHGSHQMSVAGRNSKFLHPSVAFKNYIYFFQIVLGIQKKYKDNTKSSHIPHPVSFIINILH